LIDDHSPFAVAIGLHRGDRFGVGKYSDVPFGRRASSEDSRSVGGHADNVEGRRRGPVVDPVRFAPRCALGRAVCSALGWASALHRCPGRLVRKQPRHEIEAQRQQGDKDHERGDNNVIPDLIGAQGTILHSNAQAAIAQGCIGYICRPQRASACVWR
jgi:hypothetical protein